MNFIGKMLPVKGYYVLLKNHLPINYAKSLTHLYQPLIGIKAITLYQTLLHEAELQNKDSIQTHHTLMNYLNIPLDEIYEARLKLEGIGLLRTYEHERSEKKYLTYELQRPFSPEEFFNDVMFSELLCHHIGEKKFLSLKEQYTIKLPENVGHDITVSFDDVFQTFSGDFIEQGKQQSRKNTKKPKVNQIDFSWIEQMLKQRMIPVHKVLTGKNKQIISEIMFLYNLAAYEVEKSILWALTAENNLDIEEFRKACHDLFKMKYNETPIELSMKSTQEHAQEIKKPVTKEEQLIHHFETISPKELLENLSSGNQASEREMKLISDVMTSQGLKAPVMNVLVHYVLIQSNMQLSKAYLETIASHWSRANLKTAKEAMDFAKAQINKFQKNSTTKKNYQKQSTNEVIPDWFKDRDKQAVDKPKQKETEASEQEKEELAALIQRFAGNEPK